MKGGLTLNLLLMLFCILFSLRGFGFETGAEYIATFDFTSDFVFYSLFVVIGSVIVTSAGASVMSRLIGGSQSVIYVIPAIALASIAVYLITPIGFLINAGIPIMWKLFLMGIIWIIMFAIGWGFIRGMEV